MPPLIETPDYRLLYAVWIISKGFKKGESLLREKTVIRFSPNYLKVTKM
jgi:hypothetical protein